MLQKQGSDRPVDRWGLHWDGGFPFLLEQERALCLAEGLGALPSPFGVQRQDRERCPHGLINAWEDEPRVRVPSHPLVRAMSPVPNNTAFYVGGEARGVIEEMTQTFCAVPPGVFAPWASPLRSLAPRLTTTNMGPIVIISYDMRDFSDIVRLMSLPRSRPLLFCGRFQPPETTLIPSDGLDALRPHMSWRAIGLTILRAWIAKQCSDRTR